MSGTSRGAPRPRAIRAIVMMLLARNRRIVVSASVAVGALVALDAIQGGVSLVSALTWALGGSIMLPLAAVMAVVREKSDGTLHHLALLPVNGTEHAIARWATCLVLATPAGVLVGVLMPLLIKGGPVGGLLMAAAVVALGLAAISLLLTALQYGMPIGRGAASAMYAVVALLVFVRAGQAVWDTPVGVSTRRFLSTQAGMVSASLVLWIAIGIVSWVAARLIAYRGPRYRGEIADS